MKIAITGLSNSGKTTIFNALTGQRAETTVYATAGGSPNMGVVKVPDRRIDRLSEIYRPKKTAYAAVEYIDYIGLIKGDPKQNKAVFDHIRDADALVHVVRAFDDDAVVHPLGGADPLRDVRVVESELIFGDFELVEKRLESMEQMSKKGKKPPEDERKVLLKCREALEKETPLRDVGFSPDELRTIRHLQFYSIKPEVIVININEADLNTEKAGKVQAELEGLFKGNSARVLSICGKIEMELSELSPDEARAFLDDLGIEEPALNKLIHTSYGLLGLISFITVGEDEVRAWTIKRGESAHAAAGKIHSDIEKGFIRAEVISFEDFSSQKDMAEARSKGLLRLEGKTYEVKDGDIINFRFSV
ncbi:MAG: redox-regulated ATPase YchF [Thermodesulfovibrionales bacterium]|nr:redox-regulated ATPase YchF [Thermodesulfovibrionales bacterium]